MGLLGARWRNFRSFRDTDWIDFKPITVLLGANATGKTSLIAPLLLLKQTDESRDVTLALKTKGRLFNAGSYRDLVFRHETDREVVLELCFRRYKQDKKQRELDLGNTPPGQLSLTYVAAEDGQRAVLHQYLVRDARGKEMLKRQRREDGGYSLDGLDLKGADPRWTQAITEAPLVGFLFDPTNVFSGYYNLLRKEHPQGPPSTEISIPMGEAHSQFFAITGTTSSDVSTALTETRYLGPLRDRPKRIYEIGGEAPYSVGPAGQYAPEILFRNRSGPLAKVVNEWIHRFDFGDELKCEPLADGVFSLSLRRDSTPTAVNLADTGFGLSQVLPLIVEGFFADQGSMIVAEQPEIHLNPRLQGILADLFASITTRRVKMLVETHSEHFLLRLRRLVAEGTLRADDVALYFIERDGDTSAVRRIAIDKTGHIVPEEWPAGFFEDALGESLALATAQARHAK